MNPHAEQTSTSATTSSPFPIKLTLSQQLVLSNMLPTGYSFERIIISKPHRELANLDIDPSSLKSQATSPCRPRLRVQDNSCTPSAWTQEQADLKQLKQRQASCQLLKQTLRSVNKMISYSLDLPLKKTQILDTLLTRFISWLKCNATLQSTFTSKLTNIQSNIAFHPYPTFQQFELDVFNVILELRSNSRSRLWQQLAAQMTSQLEVARKEYEEVEREMEKTHSTQEGSFQAFPLEKPGIQKLSKIQKLVVKKKKKGLGQSKRAKSRKQKPRRKETSQGKVMKVASRVVSKVVAKEQTEPQAISSHLASRQQTTQINYLFQQLHRYDQQMFLKSIYATSRTYQGFMKTLTPSEFPFFFNMLVTMLQRSRSSFTLQPPKEEPESSFQIESDSE